jgi:RNA-directed DNA polymerase
MIEQVLNRHNTMRALQQVKSNKGSAGVDRMPVSELYGYLSKNRHSIESDIRESKYLPQAILGSKSQKATERHAF